jgi:hypothetical protein
MHDTPVVSVGKPECLGLGGRPARRLGCPVTPKEALAHRADETDFIRLEILISLLARKGVGGRSSLMTGSVGLPGNDLHAREVRFAGRCLGDPDQTG